MRFEKIVVTGGAGRLGRHVVAALKEEAEVAVVDLRDPGDGLPCHVVDMTDWAGLKAAFAGADAVVHLAAIPNPRSAPADVTFATNVRGAWTVLQAAEDAGVRRVAVASSDSVVGFHYNPPDWFPAALPIDERHPLRPTEFYSLSKRVTETIAESFAFRGRMEVVVIRPTHIVFPPEHPELTSRGSDVQNYHLWTYVSPEDVAEGFRLALAADRLKWDVFFIAAADGLNTRPTLEMLVERYGRLPDDIDRRHFERHPTASVLDTAHAREVLGFAPKSDWRPWAAAVPQVA